MNSLIKRKASIKQQIANKIIYLVLLVLIVVIIFIEPRFLSFLNLKNILAQSATKIIIALGAGMVLLVRGVDLSTGRMVGLSALVVGSLMQKSSYTFKMFPDLPEIPLIIPIIFVVIMGVFFGSLSGISIAYFKVPPIIATLSMQLVLYGIASLYYDAGGAQPIGGLNDNLIKIGTGSLKLGTIQIPYLILVAIAVSAFMWFIWNKTKFGKYIYAIGGNPDAAKVSGINVEVIQLIVYAFAAVLFALAATLEIGRIGSATNTTGATYEMDAIAACVIGGVSMSGGIGKVGGIVTGVLIFTVINYGLAFIGVNMYWQFIVKGLVILFAVVLDMRKYTKRK